MASVKTLSSSVQALLTQGSVSQASNPTDKCHPTRQSVAVTMVSELLWVATIPCRLWFSFCGNFLTKGCRDSFQHLLQRDRSWKACATLHFLGPGGISLYLHFYSCITHRPLGCENVCLYNAIGLILLYSLAPSRTFTSFEACLSALKNPLPAKSACRSLSAELTFCANCGPANSCG